jgi:copper(I)-binding protein
MDARFRGKRCELNIIRTAALFVGLMSAALVRADSAVLDLSDAWVRALPPGQANTAAYLRVANPGDSVVRVVGGSSDIAARVEIHTTREVDGYQRMVQLQQLELAPGQQLELAPGGTHLMLLELERMPAPGEQVPLCLVLASGQQVCTTAGVRRGDGQHAHQHHQH